MLDWKLYNNSLGRWAAAVAILAAGILLLYVVRRVVMSRLERVARRTTTEVDDFALDLLRRTRFFFVFFLALSAASYVVTLDSTTHRVIRGLTVVATAIQALIWGSGIVTFGVDRYTRRHAEGGEVSPTTVSALSYLGRGVVFLIVLIIALDSLGVKVTALVTGLGVGGIAIALAVQNILGDLFGALSIVLDKPFVVGDAIAVDGIDGTVEKIGLKTTRVRASSGEQVVFSNADLLRSRIRNFRRMQERRIVFSVGAALATPPDLVARVPALLAEIVRAQPQVRFDRAHLRRIGDTALEFETVYWVTTPDYLVFMNTQQAINLAILQRFGAEGIALALPTRAVVLMNENGGGRQQAAGDGGWRDVRPAGDVVR